MTSTGFVAKTGSIAIGAIAAIGSLVKTITAYASAGDLIQNSDDLCSVLFIAFGISVVILALIGHDSLQRRHHRQLKASQQGTADTNDINNGSDNHETH